MSAEADPHRNERELAAGWALHALEPADEAAFALHLRSCAECATEVEATEDMAALLATDVVQYDPPARLRTAVLGAAGSPQVPRQNQPAGMAPWQLESSPARQRMSLRHRDGWRHGAGRNQSARRANSPRKVLVAAAAVMVLAFGAVAGWVGTNVFSPQGTSSVSALSEQNVMSALTDPAVRKVALTEQGSSVPMALLLAGPKDATMLPVNMPKPASNSQYVLWGVPDAAGATPILLGGVSGVSDARGARSVVAMGNAVPANFSNFAVSVEPAGSTPTVPTTIVANGQARA